jgi:hypothetical protein
VLFSPFTGDGDMGSLFTMSRLVGRLWLSDGKRDLSALQIKAGHAFASKSELEARKAAKPPRP